MNKLEIAAKAHYDNMVQEETAHERIGDLRSKVRKIMERYNYMTHKFKLNICDGFSQDDNPNYYDIEGTLTYHEGECRILLWSGRPVSTSVEEKVLQALLADSVNDQVEVV